MSVAYLDTSALVKLVIDETESGALEAWLSHRESGATSALARVEIIRAVFLSGAPAIERARAVLRSFALIPLDTPILDAAAILQPATMRSLDAIHLATALTIGGDLEALVTYDQRMLDGARLLGLPTASPA